MSLIFQLGPDLSWQASRKEKYGRADFSPLIPFPLSNLCLSCAISLGSFYARKQNDTVILNIWEKKNH